jgi:membrane fusion protein (multidrug efflux system)
MRPTAIRSSWSNPRRWGESEKVLALRQQFVQLGKKRGDFISVKKGLEAGQTIVTTGVFKLRNGMPVAVDNTLAPSSTWPPVPTMRKVNTS